LPPLSPFELDRLILSAMKLRWQKTAMVIIKVSEAAQAKGLEISDEEIADRVIALDAAGMINSDGNLALWRHSEVCLKPEEGG
jgi:hypothetical protein